MNDSLFAKQFAKELEAESGSTLKCLERIPVELFSYKPHKKSMEMGYLASLVASIPMWISHIIKYGEVNFSTFPQTQIKSTQQLVDYFNANITEAKAILQSVEDGGLEGMFFLKSKEEELFHSPKKNQVEMAINHMVHHRGQLTVYMRLNDIAVPSIYGPSADDRTYSSGI